MYYDLVSFGRYICRKRKSLAYTQQDISILSSISTDSLRRIENGKVHPTHETLEYNGYPLHSGKC